jgi:hypothetical protein
MATYASTHVIDEIRLWQLQKAECRSRSKAEVVKEVKVWRRGGGAHPFSSDRKSPYISRSVIYVLFNNY